MTIDDRASSIVHTVSALDPRFTRAADPKFGTRARTITDAPAIWDALIVPDYLPNVMAGPPVTPDGGPWDLFCLSAYGQPRLTAHVRNDEVRVRLYQPGVWERAFFFADLPDVAPMLPS